MIGGDLITYRPDIQVLDATIRDGGLVNDFYFTDEFIRALYEANIKAGVDYMEFGYKASKEMFDVNKFGKWKFCNEEDIRAIISHGYGLCTEEVKPETNLEKSLFALDELTGIVMACALMRPTGITDLEVSSLKKKFKDKKFAAKCNREIIKQGAETLGMPLEELMELTIKGMRTEADALGLGAKE